VPDVSAPHVAVGAPIAGLRVAREDWLGAPALSYPDRPPTLVHALDAAVRDHGDVEAVVDGDRRVTYAELAALVEGAVAAIANRSPGSPPLLGPPARRSAPRASRPVTGSRSPRRTASTSPSPSSRPRAAASSWWG
jgi:hypothetical protein